MDAENESNVVSGGEGKHPLEKKIKRRIVLPKNS